MVEIAVSRMVSRLRWTVAVRSAAGNKFDARRQVVYHGRDAALAAQFPVIAEVFGEKQRGKIFRRQIEVVAFKHGSFVGRGPQNRHLGVVRAQSSHADMPAKIQSEPRIAHEQAPAYADRLSRVTTCDEIDVDRGRIKRSDLPDRDDAVAHRAGQVTIITGPFPLTH